MNAADKINDYQRRIQVLADIQRIAASLANGDGHVIMLSDYEVINLREALTAMGYGMSTRSPLEVMHTGDWVGQLWQKLPWLTDPRPNVDAETQQARARDWKKS